MHEFIIAWNHLLDNMGKHCVQDAQLHDVFYRKIKDEPEMEYDIKHDERLDEGHPQKTYEHLQSCVHLDVRMQEQTKNLLEREALLSSKPLKGKDVCGTTALAALGVEQTNKGSKANKKTEDKTVGASSSGGGATTKTKSKR